MVTHQQVLFYRIHAQDPQAEAPASGWRHVAEEEANLLQEECQYQDSQHGRDQVQPQLVFNHFMQNKKINNIY